MSKVAPRCSCTRAVGFAIDKLRLTRSFVRRSRKCTESSRAISLEILEITVEKSVGFRGRAAARRMVQISARTRASRHKNRSVLKKGASQLHAGRFSVDPDPDFGRRGRCRARSPTPARFASSRRTLSLRVLLSFQADRSIGALLRGWPPGRRPPPSRSTSSDDLPPDARPNRV